MRADYDTVGQHGEAETLPQGRILKSELNILIVLDYSPPFYGGMGAHLNALGDEARARGHRLHLAFPRERDWVEEASRHASTVRTIPSIHDPIRRGFTAALQEVIRSERIDAVHLHFSYALAIACALRPCHVPILYHWHNPPRALLRSTGLTPKEGSHGAMASGLAIRLSRLTGGLFARIGDAAIQRHIAISGEIENLLVKHRWTQPQKIIRLPNALPELPDQPATLRALPSPFVLGSVANFRAQKDHTTLLRAFARCIEAEPGLRLDLIGDGETRPHMEALAKDLAIEPFVRFRGHVQDPGESYRRMDAFVLSTHYEGHGLAVLEAMGYGLPIIATDLPSIRGALADSSQALLVPPQDPSALAASILRLYGDPSLRAELARRSRSAALHALTPDQWARQLVTIYESVVLEYPRDGTPRGARPSRRSHARWRWKPRKMGLSIRL